MKLKLAFMVLLIQNSIFSIFSMEQEPSKFIPESLRFKTAWAIASGERQLCPGAIPEELMELVNLLRAVVSCKTCTEEEKKFFIAIADKPNIDISKSFGTLLESAKGEVGATDKQKVLNGLIRQASAKGNVDLANTAIVFGADVNAQDKNGYTPLLKAAEAGRISIVPALLNAGAKVDAKNFELDTALIRAALFGRREIVEMLLKASADLNIQDKLGNTALIYAVKAGRKEIVSVLLDAGADTFIMNNKNQTALDFALDKTPQVYSEIVDLILKAQKKSQILVLN